MKNLKKVLALVVALTMVLGTVGFAAYTDVAEDAGEYTAVSTLSSLGILTGYEDGSFKPDGDITRAEFAAVVHSSPMLLLITGLPATLHMLLARAS